MDIVLIVSTLVSSIILISVVELIRRNRLKERYSLIWLFSSIVMLVFSLSRQSLHVAAQLIGIKYPPSLIFLFGLLFLVVINIHFASVISTLSDRNKSLAQELALLREHLERIDGKGEGGQGQGRGRGQG